MLFCQWSEEACAAHLTQRDGYQATTQCQLKDQLYQEIINYFDKGKVTTANNKLLSQICFSHVDLRLTSSSATVFIF